MGIMVGTMVVNMMNKYLVIMMNNFLVIMMILYVILVNKFCKSLSGVMSSSAEKKPLFENKEASMPNETAAWCSFYGAGIICMLVVYGLLQERIITRPYGTGKDEVYFTDSVFSVSSTAWWL